MEAKQQNHKWTSNSVKWIHSHSEVSHQDNLIRGIINCSGLGLLDEPRQHFQLQIFYYFNLKPKMVLQTIFSYMISIQRKT